MTALEWEGLSLSSVLATTGTPALVLSERRLRENVRDLARGFQAEGTPTTLRYCAKTNPDPEILRIVREEGLDVMTSQSAEVQLALAAGFAPGQIAYQRPVLEDGELDAAIRAGVRRFHAFRPSDLQPLTRAASRHGCSLRVSLRIAARSSGMFVLSGAVRRLGMSPADAATILPGSDAVVVDALNTYIGTQLEDPRAFRPAIRRLVRLALDLRSQGHPVEEINLGGGIPSPSIRRLTPGRLLTRNGGRPDAGSPAGYATALARLFAAELRGAGAFRPRLVLEPGRAVVGNAAVLLARVVAVQGRWRFLDCGRNTLVESPLAFTRWIAPLTARSSETATVHLSGPTLNTLDVVDLHRRLPDLRTGDVVALGDAGAYTLARATRYAGLGPAVWMARLDGSLVRIRRAETVGDLTAPMLGAAG